MSFIFPSLQLSSHCRYSHGQWIFLHCISLFSLCVLGDFHSPFLPLQYIPLLPEGISTSFRLLCLCLSSPCLPFPLSLPHMPLFCPIIATSPVLLWSHPENPPILSSHPSISTSLRRRRGITTPCTKELTIVQGTEHHLRQTPTEMPAWPETVISNLNNVQIMIAMDVTMEGDGALTLIKDRSMVETQAVGNLNVFTQLWSQFLQE